MSQSNTRAGGSGLTLGTVLTIVFVVLKLCHVITWSWVWVLAPLWIGFGISLLVLIIGLIVVAAVSRR